MSINLARRTIEHPARWQDKPRYQHDNARSTIKYPGEIVLTDLLSPAMIVRDGGKLERWDGVEGRVIAERRRLAAAEQGEAW